MRDFKVYEWFIKSRDNSKPKFKVYEWFIKSRDNSKPKFSTLFFSLHIFVHMLERIIPYSPLYIGQDSLYLIMRIL